MHSSRSLEIVAQDWKEEDGLARVARSRRLSKVEAGTDQEPSGPSHPQSSAARDRDVFPIAHT